ncbi:hypothetical protein ABZ785_12370 [Streptomyces incarnatus]
MSAADTTVMPSGSPRCAARGWRTERPSVVDRKPLPSDRSPVSVPYPYPPLSLSLSLS